MTRLIPNPVGEILQPLVRVEEALGRLATQLTPIAMLSSIHEELLEVNQTLALVLGELRTIRGELATVKPSGAEITGSRAPQRRRTGRDGPPR